MTERPIIFSAPMVRAILAGAKTQTRRVVKAPGWAPGSGDYIGRMQIGLSEDRRVGLQAYFEHRETQTWHGVRCPYGQPGDRLWVRETWAVPHRYDHLGPSNIPVLGVPTHYAATEDRGGLLWRPSIHMCRWASRITLEITSVRVERLQAISEADAIAEGVQERQVSENDSRWLRYDRKEESLAYSTCGDPRESYRTLWESLHGPGSWDANPWVWVVEFKRINQAGNT